MYTGPRLVTTGNQQQFDDEQVLVHVGERNGQKRELYSKVRWKDPTKKEDSW
jgi:hypothetical protein